MVSRATGIVHTCCSQLGESLPEEELRELTAGEQVKAWRLCQSDKFITRDEFCLAMLLRLGKVAEEDLQLVQDTFAKLDVRGEGRLEPSGEA